MRESRPLGLTLGFGVLLAGMVTLATVAASRYSEPFPPLSISLSTPVTRLSDFVGISVGLRKLAADIAWIQTLVYYGTLEEGFTEDDEHQGGGGRYLQFLAYCQRVVRLDPNFKYVFYYGSGVLGWNLDRLDEADALLREGIRAHPKEWRFQQFLAGMAFQKNHKINDLIDFLKVFSEQNDCPNILRSILANIYKKQKRYAEAVHVWTIVYETQDPTYLSRAESQIQELTPLAQNQARK